MTTEIPQNLWPPFCERLKQYRGAISIHWIQPGGAMRDVAENEPLQTLAFQKQNECNDIITIETGRLDERPLQHQITGPIRLVLRKNGDSGRYKQLEILAETGKTEVMFSPGIDAMLLEKLAA